MKELILNWLSGPLIQLGLWMLGTLIAALVFKVFIGVYFKALTKGADSAIKVIKLLENPFVRKLVRRTILYVEKSYHQLEGSEKMKIAIKKVQRFVPDWAMSDEKVELLIETMFKQLGPELERIKKESKIMEVRNEK